MSQIDYAKSNKQLNIRVTRVCVQQKEPHDLHDVPAARAGASLREVALPGRLQQVAQILSYFYRYDSN